MPASISSTFDIVMDTTLNNGGTGNITITNPGRAFRVEQAFVTGAASCQIDVQKNTSAGASVLGGNQTLAASAQTDTALPIDAANDDFTASDNIFMVNASANNVTRVVLRCVAAGGGQALATT